MDIRVYYHDTDAGGVVYHGAYLDFAERGRTEFLRAMGHHHGELKDKYNMIFVVRHLEIGYLLPGLLDDALVMESSVSEIKNSSFVMKQIIKRDGTPITEINVVLVCINIENMKPIKIPDPLKTGLEQYLVE